MIKCNVTICGTVSRAAQMRTNKEGKPFMTLGVSIVIPAKSGINKTVEVSVAKDGGSESELSQYTVGSRIEIVGVLTFHKKGDALFFNMSATGIKGDIEFRGSLGNKIECRDDKKGNPFLTFSAFSTEKNGEDFAFTWVHFMYFGEKQKDWMIPKAGIEAKGELQLGIFNDHIDITCRVSEIKEYEKKPFTPNVEH